MLLATAVLASGLSATHPAGALLEPRVAAVSPALGQTDGGTVVTLRGSGFLGASHVIFGALPAPFVVLSDVEIWAVTPPAPEGVVQVRVAAFLTSSPEAGAADDFRYHIQPRINGVSPRAGLDMGGGTVTITGSGLRTTTSVRFGRAVASFKVVSDARLDVTLPPKDPNDAGPVDVFVYNTWARSTTLLATQDDFRYFPTPRIAAVAPYEGPAVGGFTVRITGAGFTDATSVSFDSIAMTDLRVDATGNEIFVVAPEHEVGRVKITVSNPGGTGPARADSADTLGFFDVGALEDALLARINNHRASKAKNRLARSDDLADGAREWSRTMAVEGVAHAPPGWCPAAFRSCGELVQGRDYFGSASAAAFVEELFQAFKESADHNAIMLNAFSHGGAGIVFENGYAFVTVRFGQT